MSWTGIGDDPLSEATRGVVAEINRAHGLGPVLRSRCEAGLQGGAWLLVDPDGRPAILKWAAARSAAQIVHRAETAERLLGVLEQQAGLAPDPASDRNAAVRVVASDESAAGYRGAVRCGSSVPRARPSSPATTGSSTPIAMCSFRQATWFTATSTPATSSPTT